MVNKYVLNTISKTMTIVKKMGGGQKNSGFMTVHQICLNVIILYLHMKNFYTAHIQSETESFLENL